MADRQPTIAIYPGSFDPITLGHVNIIKRAANLFDKVIVCVMVNSAKQCLFTPEKRVELIRRVLAEAGLENVEADCSNILLADYAKEKGAKTIVKGLRAVSDYEIEVQMALVNSKINPVLDTVFLPAGEKYTYLSSTIVKEMVRYGVDLKEFVPREIVEDLLEKADEWRKS